MHLSTNLRSRLVWVSLTLLFVVISYYVFGWLLDLQGRVNLEYHKLAASKAEGQALMAEADAWQARAGWLKHSLPILGDEGRTKAEVLETALQGARDQHLQILDQSLGEIQVGPSCTSVSAKMKVDGSMESLCRWLSRLQSPESFYAVSSFSMHASDNDKNVVCSLIIKRYFQEVK